MERMHDGQPDLAESWRELAEHSLTHDDLDVGGPVDERILVITPSRGRPDRLAYMLGETLRTSGPGTHVAICYDDDDPEIDGYAALAEKTRRTWPGRTFWHRGRRRTLAGWTNYITMWPRAVRYAYLASFGDDHVPRTDGWDDALAGAIEAAGGTGIGYGDDRHQHENLPTAPVISADIVKVLGWMILPGLEHYYCDNAWRDLADMAGVRVYVRDVVIEHVHPDAHKASRDLTYSQAQETYWAADEQVYLSWAQSRDGQPSMRDLDVRAVLDAVALRALASPRESA